MPEPGGAKETTDRDITQKILDTLEENGSMNQTQYRRMVLLALLDVVNTSRSCKIGLTNMERRIETLEENSILLIARKHPKIFWAIALGLLVLTLSTVLHLGLGEWLLEVFDIPPIPTP